MGPEATVLHVHESVVRPHSCFFDAALDKCWKEGRDKRVLLPEDTPEIAELYLKFLYTGKIMVGWTQKLAQPKSHENLPEYFTLAHLYVFGEKIGDTVFKNAVMDTFVRRMTEPVAVVVVGSSSRTWSPTTRVVDILYCGTMPGSPARRLMVDAHIFKGGENWFTDCPDENNKEFLMDLTCGLYRQHGLPKLSDAPFLNANGKRSYHERTSSKPTGE